MMQDHALRRALLAVLDAHPATDPVAAISQAWAASEVLAIVIARAAMLTPDPRTTGADLARREANALASSVALKIGESLKPLAR